MDEQFLVFKILWMFAKELRINPRLNYLFRCVKITAKRKVKLLLLLHLFNFKKIKFSFMCEKNFEKFS